MDGVTVSQVSPLRVDTVDGVTVSRFKIQRFKKLYYPFKNILKTENCL